MLAYHSVLFSNGEDEDVTAYMLPPSDEVDAAWDALYNFNMQVIPASSAKKLQNETSAIPGDEDHHIVMLDVFHQLHCLNMIRKALAPDYYHGWKINYEHSIHCIDSLRQSLMCSVDITPIPFMWHEELGMLQHEGRILHTCRDFELVRQWALDNEMAPNLNWMEFPHVIPSSKP
ncbi:hypothetical protein K469DRAFT_726441 [Zopfia rhizophila CBS 207.26]|uniref:Tat pathway signal sequence protein n=1 Tax=Zopfia rhizophila CBS 207.26 TaxID=1314779 RepID=A0A6A6E747_9PEZI|nr:hypothetical protein K469DRAFT_726441 [Zopfia rhizophila CBS 207.26]